MMLLRLYSIIFEGNDYIYIIMKKIAAILLMVSLNVSAQKIPSKHSILKSLTLANQYFMQKWPDAGKPIFTNIERPSNIWTRSVYYEGLMQLYAIDKQQSYYDYTQQWGNF